MQELLKQWECDDVFNADETNLFWRQGPLTSLMFAAVKSKKLDKMRYSNVLCANASGSQKRKPLVIVDHSSMT